MISVVAKKGPQRSLLGAAIVSVYNIFPLFFRPDIATNKGTPKEESQKIRQATKVRITNHFS